MRKVILAAFVLNLVSLALSAQSPLVAKYIKGDIFLNDGTTVSGYIYFDFERVSTFQNSVSYINQASYDNLKATGKVKMKEIEKISPKEASYYTLENGKKFVPETFADLSAVGTGAIPKKYFFEQLVDGKIKLYKRYVGLEGLVSGEDAQLAMDGGEKLAERNRNTFELLIIKDTKNVKSISTVNLTDFISDNTAVLEKYNADNYGNLKSNFSSKIKLGETNHAQAEPDLIRLLTDYNAPN